MIHGPAAGLRHAARADRQGARDRPRGRTSSSPATATCCAFPGPPPTCISLKARGADVRTVYSPWMQFESRSANPIGRSSSSPSGFETTAPANAMRPGRPPPWGLEELLGAGFARPPRAAAMCAILESPTEPGPGLPSPPGHVCAVDGLDRIRAMRSDTSPDSRFTGLRAAGPPRGDTDLAIRQIEKRGGPSSKPVRPGGFGERAPRGPRRPSSASSRLATAVARPSA